MATRLGDLLDDARRRTFVGRRDELASFADEVFTRPGMAERVMRLGAGAARYPIPGPELLAALGA